MKENFHKISGLTLIEILIGIVISVLMMGAMYTAYNAVNNSYSKVTDRAKISAQGRDLVTMIVRDIRNAGFRYFGDNKDTGDPEKKTGNKALLKQFEIHNSNDIDVRRRACPIIFFKRKSIDGRQKGFLEFNGFGVITNAERIVQHNRKTNKDFVNYSWNYFFYISYFIIICNSCYRFFFWV